MSDFFTNSAYVGIVVSLITYMIGVKLKNKFKIALFNPILLSIVFTIIILLVCKIDYETYNISAKYLSYLITPATVCLAIPLYEQLELLKKEFLAIMLGVLSGVLTSLTTVFVLAYIMKLSHEEYVTLLPKSITTAIGMGVSEELGGHVTITVAVIIITGIIGNVLAEFMCKIFRVKEKIAVGIALGSSSHVLGSAKAIEIGDVEGAMSGLSIAVAGIMTVAFVSIYATFI